MITDQLFDYVEGEEKEEHIFFRYARWCYKECRRACEEALENLLAAVDERRTFEVLRAFNHMYGVRLEAHKRILLGDKRSLPEGADLRKALPKNCVMIRKVKPFIKDFIDLGHDYSSETTVYGTRSYDDE